MRNNIFQCEINQYKNTLFIFQCKKNYVKSILCKNKYNHIAHFAPKFFQQRKIYTNLC